jgi:hypothetical protein
MSKRAVIMTETTIAEGFERLAGTKVELDEATIIALHGRGKCRAPRTAEEEAMAITPPPALKPGEAATVNIAPNIAGDPAKKK